LAGQHLVSGLSEVETMTNTVGYYSIVQFCPDASRLEAANVGVVLFRPTGMRPLVKMSHGNERVRRLFTKSEADLAQVNSLKKGVEDRIKNEHSEFTTLEKFAHFVAMQVNLIRMTPPRPVAAPDPVAALDALFERLVETTREVTPREPMRTKLELKFGEAKLWTKIAQGVTVTIPALQKSVEVPFAYQNGRFNLIQPVRFRGAEIEKAVATACTQAVAGDSLYNSSGGEYGQLQLVVVGEFREDDKAGRTQAAVRNVFREHRVKLVVESEIDALVDEIRQHGKELSA
jgi:hypothetical protein